MVLPALLLLVGAGVALARDSCKCIPSDPCWPTSPTWNSLNSSVDGRLIRNDPIARPCYPGDGQDTALCQEINDNWGDSWWLSRDAVGYSYPLSNACPPINTTVASYPTCNLGTAPVYTINATKAEHVSAGIAFAQEHNIRLVIKNTGHDIQGRSQGYGSLSVWMKYVQDGIKFHDTYAPSDGSVSDWTGSAIQVAGGYIWSDVYEVAAAHHHIVVGGGDPTVGAIGGYLQGGGHSHASHDFGLAADNVLEMTVVLASGHVVTASPTQNPDLFRALRGGGGGTFGVVLSATLKAYPTRPYVAHTLTILPLPANENGSLSGLLDITADIMSKYPLLSDAGFSGYAELLPGWIVPEASAAGSPAVYTQTFGKALGVGASNPSSSSSPSASTNETMIEIDQVKSFIEEELMSPLLQQYNQSSSSPYLITQSWQSHPTYESYRSSVSGVSPVGQRSVFMASRLFDGESLSSSSSPNNTKTLSDMLHVLVSSPPSPSSPSPDIETFATGTTVLELLLIGGGKVFLLDDDENTKTWTSSVNPGWRTSYLLLEVVSLPAQDADSFAVEEFHRDLTGRKGGKMREVSPRVGTYGNEADWNEGEEFWREDFFGRGEEGNYEWLRRVKGKYDPEGVFYCRHCVGSEGWEEERKGVVEGYYGALCRIG